MGIAIAVTAGVLLVRQRVFFIVVIKKIVNLLSVKIVKNMILIYKIIEFIFIY